MPGWKKHVPCRQCGGSIRPNKSGLCLPCWHGAPYDPSPQEIRRRCREIQAEWSERERLKRQVGMGREEWAVPGAADPGLL